MARCQIELDYGSDLTVDDRYRVFDWSVSGAPSTHMQRDRQTDRQIVGLTSRLDTEAIHLTDFVQPIADRILLLSQLIESVSRTCTRSSGSLPNVHT